MNIVDENIKTIVEHVGTPLYDFEDKNILITGGCGFLGSWFVAVFEYLNRNKFEKPCRVTVMDSFIAADKNNAITDIVEDNIRFLARDVSKTDFLKNDDGTIPEYEYIIHAAGIASPIYYRKFPIETIDGMVLGLSHLLKYSAERKIKSLLYFSSSEIYGNPRPENVPIPEEYYGNVSCIGPRSCYDESKRMGEAMCVAYHRIHGIPLRWVRPFNVYGPGMRIKDDRVVPKFMFQAIKGEPLTVHIPGVQTRTFCYITDAMIGFFKTMLVGRTGEVYNIGHAEPEITMVDLANKINVLFENKSEIREVEMPTEYPQDQAQRRCPDLGKAGRDFQYKPLVTLDEGLQLMAEWCKAQL